MMTLDMAWFSIGSSFNSHDIKRFSQKGSLLNHISLINSVDRPDPKTHDISLLSVGLPWKMYLPLICVLSVLYHCWTSLYYVLECCHSTHAHSLRACAIGDLTQINIKTKSVYTWGIHLGARVKILTTTWRLATKYKCKLCRLFWSTDEYHLPHRLYVDKYNVRRVGVPNKRNNQT